MIIVDEEIECFSLTSSPRHAYKAQTQPILDIKIIVCFFQGIALIDTAEKKSVVGSFLYKLLQERGHPCAPASMRVKLADGAAQTRQVLTTALSVVIKTGKIVCL